MPILEIHLADAAYSDEQCERLLVESSQLYAEVLASPIDRVRVVIRLHPPGLVAVAGVPLNRGGRPAPYFHFLVLEGRPLAERHRLLTGFTDLIVEILGAERGAVRGGCWPILPENWCIGGTPANVMRAAEVQGRAAKAAASD